MPATAVVVQYLSQTPEAVEAFTALVEAERKLHRTSTLAGELMGGVIPVEVYQADVQAAHLRVRQRLATEQERVLCTRYGMAFDEDASSEPDRAARNYLGIIGLVDSAELLPAETAEPL